MIRYGPAGIPLSCKGRTLKDGIEDVHNLALTALEIQMVRPKTYPRPPDEDEEDEGTGLAIQMPMMTGDEISRLEALIESKESLIKKAIGADSLAVGEKDGKLDFPWFKADAEPDEIIAYTHFVTALCRTAREATRITGKDKPVENEKYAFRCFLLRIGFIGDEYKVSRKLLLKNFSGSSAWKSGAPAKEVQA